MPQVARPHQRVIRFTDVELAQLRERARITGRPLARYVRETALGVVPEVPRGAADAELIRHLARVGNDLNQLAREANAGHAFDSAEKLDAALAALNAVLDRL
jgi:hypothetical protein